MNKTSDDTLSRYYQEAASWSEDRGKALRTSRRVAWIVAGVATGIAALEAIALVSLAPLKTVVPYTLLVDRQTGNVEALKPLDQQHVTPDDALVRSFLAQYVIAREGFDINALRNDYRKVALWSAEEARDRYLASMQANNPQSPLASLPRQALVEVEVRSISSLNATTALVRFVTYRTDPGGQRQAAQNWVATITYRFSPARMSEADRMLNPLGFQVVRYRGNAETIVPEASQASQSSLPQTETLPGAAGSVPQSGIVPLQPGAISGKLGVNPSRRGAPLSGPPAIPGATVSQGVRP